MVTVVVVVWLLLWLLCGYCCGCCVVTVVVVVWLLFNCGDDCFSCFYVFMVIFGCVGIVVGMF